MSDGSLQAPTAGGARQRNPPIAVGFSHIGPLGGVQLALRGLTVFYGPNGSGKTAVAQALGLAVRLLRGGEAASAEALALISRGAEAGKISLGDYEIELARRPRGAVAVKVAKAGKVLYQREASGVIATGLDERPSVDVLLRVRLGGVVVVDRGIKTLPLIELASPNIATQWGAEGEGAAGMDEYAGYVEEVNSILSGITDHELAAVGGRLYYRSNGVHFDEENIASGIQRVALIAAAYVLARRLSERLGASPLLFIENFDAAMHLDYAVPLFRLLAGSEIPTVVETHSGLVLRTAVLKQVDYYVFADGAAAKDLKSLELLWREVQVAADL
jgi:energy-coupling factor transporter ATP-binding protein EcfA2